MLALARFFTGFVRTRKLSGQVLFEFYILVAVGVCSLEMGITWKTAIFCETKTFIMKYISS